MIFGADNQNKNLKNAASKRIDTTPRTRTSNKLAAKIATNKTGDNSRSVANKTTVNHEPRSLINDGTPDPMRGSLEGYMHAPSTMIQMSGVGYDNKNIQKARYTPKLNFKGLDIKPANFGGFKKYDKINNKNFLDNKNSVSRIKNSLNLEKMFR